EQGSEPLLVPAPLGDELLPALALEVAPFADEHRRDVELLGDHAQVRAQRRPDPVDDGPLVGNPVQPGMECGSALARHLPEEVGQGGGQVEKAAWMHDDYRAKLVKFVEMHGNSELMGVLPEREWILRAPTLQRKLALTAKVQDEVGHAQLIYRVVEDLGKPRERCLADLISGKSKFHNVFHYPTKTWGDVGVIAWLVDAAAIISQKALLKCSYAPYARIMKKICWEESFHILHGRDVILAMVTGTPEQFE